MSSSRVRFSLHISAHRGEERRGEKEAGGVKKAKKCEGDEEGRSDGGERKGGKGQGRKRTEGLMWKEKCLLYWFGHVV